MKSRPMLRVSPKGTKRIVKQEGELNKIERSDEWHSNDAMHGTNHEGPLHKEKKHAKKHHKSPKRHASKGKGKVEKVMHDWKEGKLHSGSKKGPVVSSQKQAVAIALSEARKKGAKIPKKRK